MPSEGKNRRDMGREAFIERVWDWKAHYGGAILKQMKRLGTSVDWSREYFTMDERMSRAVREAFVRLYEEGLIYRGKYIVNWCPRCITAVSDLEVVHEETPGKLYEIRYPVVGSPNEFIIVATTRPETMLGDTAIAVNSADERYKHLHGKHVMLPLMNREIPIITDDVLANPEFGTGAVKVTPSHDPNDFEAGLRNQLPQIEVMNEVAQMNDNAGPTPVSIASLLGNACWKIWKKAATWCEKRLRVPLGTCSRCKNDHRASPIDSMVRENPASSRPRNRGGRTRRNQVRSRKLHQDVLRVDAQYPRLVHLAATVVGTSHSGMALQGLRRGYRCPRGARELQMRQRDLEQDSDVLDTWFSSGLLPCSGLGWPDETPDLDAFYPTTLLITGFDILFFWVARMIMMNCHFMRGHKHGDVPFRTVYIHALVRDAERQKMSKTKGNVVDPIEITEKYGTDAVRFTLAIMAAPGTDIAFRETD